MFGIVPSIKSIDGPNIFSQARLIQYLPGNTIKLQFHRMGAEIFRGFHLKTTDLLHTCFWTFPLQPYYSRGENSKFYSTSHLVAIRFVFGTAIFDSV